ncbi:hypothetical protein [Bradyrhizobium arachidis]|uniref:hypothetical protein n=1 Tax=Bradyrhizobium arachidis TaxID=858423 RepID=UPI0021617B5A|nr:hypothetical protein [Bradyrhizobium arachidis]UVO30205.1 hypothetical protein KUF59_05430 [Bradyrhizobium arachidis]
MKQQIGAAFAATAFAHTQHRRSGRCMDARVHVPNLGVLLPNCVWFDAVGIVEREQRDVGFQFSPFEALTQYEAIDEPPVFKRHAACFSRTAVTRRQLHGARLRNGRAHGVYDEIWSSFLRGHNDCAARKLRSQFGGLWASIEAAARSVELVGRYSGS